MLCCYCCCVAGCIHCVVVSGGRVAISLVFSVTVVFGAGCLHCVARLCCVCCVAIAVVLLVAFTVQLCVVAVLLSLLYFLLLLYFWCWSLQLGCIVWAVFCCCVVVAGHFHCVLAAMLRVMLLLSLCRCGFHVLWLRQLCFL